MRLRWRNVAPACAQPPTETAHRMTAERPDQANCVYPPHPPAHRQFCLPVMDFRTVDFCNEHLNPRWRKRGKTSRLRLGVAFASFVVAILVSARVWGIPTTTPFSWHRPSKAQSPPVRFGGSDILMVLGSDGHHPLDVHRGAIKANREDYAIFHGRKTQTLS